MPHSYLTNPATPTSTSNSTPEASLTPSLFDHIQSLFLLQNTTVQNLYTQFKVSLSVLFSILHDKSTQSLRRAIDEHNYLCAQRAHLDLILETQNVAKQFALIENPTQEQRRRLGTLNNTLKISFANLQHLKADLLSQPDTTPNTNSKPTHPKPTPQKTTRPITTPSHTPPHSPSQHPQTAPTPTPSQTNAPHTDTNTNTTPNPTPHPTPNPTPYATFASDPRWHQIQPHLTPPAIALASRLAPHYQDVILMQPTEVAINTLNALAIHPEFTTLHTTPHNTQTPQTPQPAHPHTEPNQLLTSASAP